MRPEEGELRILRLRPRWRRCDRTGQRNYQYPSQQQRQEAPGIIRIGNDQSVMQIRKRSGCLEV